MTIIYHAYMNHLNRFIFLDRCSGIWNNVNHDTNINNIDNNNNNNGDDDFNDNTNDTTTIHYDNNNDGDERDNNRRGNESR